MSDLISRADAIEAIASRDETNGTVEVFTGREVNEILSALPSADRPTGEWKQVDSLADRLCSVCGYGVWDSEAEEYNYCPNCGAKMGGDSE